MLAALVVLVGCGRHSEPHDDSRDNSDPCAKYWVDRDGDSYGSKEMSDACELGAGVVDNSDDCADDDPLVHPGAVDACDGLDQDCNGEDGDPVVWFQDLDGDGYGTFAELAYECAQPDGFASGVPDCNDADADIHIGAEEVCGDGIDSDCDALDPPCGFMGEYDLADATARLACSSVGWQTGLLVETGDVDADGNDDVLVAALGADANMGGGFVAYGPLKGDAAIEDVAHRIPSSTETFGAGRSISLGDVNGDTFEDVGIGVPWADANGLYVLFGPVTADRTVVDADLALVGPAGTYCGHGSDLADVNDDGFADAVIGAFDDDSGAVDGGKLFVQWGPVAAGDVDLATKGDSVILGLTPSRYPGRAVRAGRDVNGDGIGDIVLNMVFDDTGGMSAGGLLVIDGPADVASLDDAGSILIGPAPTANAGTAFDAGDFDGDGFADIAAYSAQPAPGSVYIVRGPARGDIDMRDADAIIEPPEGPVRFGSGVRAGDVEGDGPDELLIGSPWDGDTRVGATYLLSGLPSGTVAALDVATAIFRGSTDDDQAGTGLAIGDLDGDAIGEVVIGGIGVGDGGGVFVVSR